MLQDLCHVGDLYKLSAHLKETLTHGSSTSQLYRMRVGDKFVQVQTKSKFFAFNPNTEPDFIMATHTLLGLVVDL